jgi:accessory gene regulator protein AgrB
MINYDVEVHKTPSLLSVTMVYVGSVIVFNVTFNNISVILVKEIGLPGETTDPSHL